MRRESDGWLNATQIAKLAGLLQGSKIRIAQDQIVGAFRTVKGGYAKIQGTWVEYKYGRQFAGAHGLDQILLPLLEYDGTTAQRLHSQPGKLPGEQILIEERARGLENMTGDQVLEPQTENTPTGSPVANIPVHEKQPSEQALNALASREDWLDSSGSEDELSPFFDSGDGDMPRPRVVSDVSHASQPPVNMNSKRKRQSEPQGHDSDDAVRAQKRMKQSLFPLASEDKVQPEPFHDYNQTSAQLLSRTIRNALLDPGTTAPSSIHGYYGHGSVNASIGIGVGRQKTGGEYSTQVGSITSRIRRERLGELGRWFDRRELADNNAVFRNVDKVRAGVPWDQMRSEEQAKVRTRVRRKILHQRYQEGRSESYFISQLLKLANESGVSNDAILGLLLQQRKSRETLVELFEGLVKVNESGTLSVNQAMSGDAEEEWETE